MHQKQKARPKAGFLWVLFLACPARRLPRDRARRASRARRSVDPRCRHGHALERDDLHAGLVARLHAGHGAAQHDGAGQDGHDQGGDPGGNGSGVGGVVVAFMVRSFREASALSMGAL